MAAMVWAVTVDCTLYLDEIARFVTAAKEVPVTPSQVYYWLRKLGFKKKRVWQVRVQHSSHPLQG